MAKIPVMQGMTVYQSAVIEFDCGCRLVETDEVGGYIEVFNCDWRKHPQHRGWLLEEAKRISEYYRSSGR
jgi:hypothetical protein